MRILMICLFALVCFASYAVECKHQYYKLTVSDKSDGTATLNAKVTKEYIISKENITEEGSYIDDCPAAVKLFGLSVHWLRSINKEHEKYNCEYGGDDAESMYVDGTKPGKGEFSTYWCTKGSKKKLKKRPLK
jgi:hypothetical protein